MTKDRKFDQQRSDKFNAKVTDLNLRTTTSKQQLTKFSDVVKFNQIARTRHVKFNDLLRGISYDP